MEKHLEIWMLLWILGASGGLVWFLCTFDLLRETKGIERLCNVALLLLLAGATLQLYKYLENNNILWCGGFILVVAVFQLYRSVEYTPYKDLPEKQNPD